MTLVRLEAYPFGRTFAVSIVDDTDGACLSAIRPVYALLTDAGLRTTKTVWPLAATAASGGYAALSTAGDTLQDPAYRVFCQRLHDAGFEMAMHTASAGDSTRDETLRGYAEFEEAFGHSPLTNVMHARNRENLYWGTSAVANPFLAKLIELLEPNEFLGHVPGSAYFWGDICRARTRYVRQFETLRANTRRFDPATPYHDPRKPYVPWWFSASHGTGTRLFEILSAASLDRLAADGGAAIVQTYLRHYCGGAGRSQSVHPRFAAVVERLALRADAWVVPVVTLLDRLRELRMVTVHAEGRTIELLNRSAATIDAVALRVPPAVVLRDASSGAPFPRSTGGQVSLGTLRPGQLVRLLADRPVRVAGIPAPPPDYRRLLAGYATRLAWQFLHGRRRLIDSREHPWIRTLSDG